MGLANLISTKRRWNTSLLRRQLRTRRHNHMPRLSNSRNWRVQLSFTPHHGLFQFTQVPFRLKKVPRTLQRAMYVSLSTIKDSSHWCIWTESWSFHVLPTSILTMCNEYWCYCRMPVPQLNLRSVNWLNWHQLLRQYDPTTLSPGFFSQNWSDLRSEAA